MIDYQKLAEKASLLRLLTEVYPAGIFSYVADSYDFWKVITEIVPELKAVIMRRNGTLTIRPDSGDPVKIVCGDPDAPEGTPERIGAWECLWNEFGGTVNEKGFRVLDSHVGLIYGDSITRERQKQILDRLEAKGFVPSIVLGIGSYTYQYNTRDTLGFAVKATWGQVNGEPREIFKSPKTDKGGEKKSAKGWLHIKDDHGTISMSDQHEPHSVPENNALNTVFKDGKLLWEESFEQIRRRLNG